MTAQIEGKKHGLGTRTKQKIYYLGKNTPTEIFFQSG